MPKRTMMIGWQTAEHGKSGLGLERWGPSHMQESIFINQKMKNIDKRDQKKEKMTIRN
jgi:hypothetical protein